MGAHNVHLVAKALCMPVAGEYSVADRCLPEPCGGSNSKENCRRDCKQQLLQNKNKKAKTEA